MMYQKRNESDYKRPDMELVAVEIERGFYLSGGGIEDVGKDEEIEF